MSDDSFMLVAICIYLMNRSFDCAMQATDQKRHLQAACYYMSGFGLFIAWFLALFFGKRV